MAEGSSTMSSERARPFYLIRRLRDPAEIEHLLAPKRTYAAYALAQLEPPLFRRSESWLAEGEGGIALVMHSRGGLGRALLTLGDEVGLNALLSTHPGPAYAFATFEIEHLPVMRRFFHVSHSQPMLRLVVDRESFRQAPPLAPKVTNTVSLRALSGEDVPEINRLSKSESGWVQYRAHQIDDGVYFGIYQDGDLVAMAGTHAISTSHRIAVVGNVFTHPRRRNHHYALQATGAVTDALLRTCSEVVLTVDPKNEPAVRAYTRLGYREDCRLIEGMVSRRDLLGLASLLRRLLALWRGRPYGRERVASAATRWDCELY
ncbi:MAG: GNAT family N-acetyltransferase [Dehalococcoidia bacterium]|jgi:RimJ/RimL family protein N-acetyltransferase